MKKVLSLLLVFVFLKAQALALSGGPVFSDSTIASYIGTYSGVLVPTTVDISGGTQSGGSSASVGLFSIAQPDTGFASGTLLLFVDGAPFSGTLTGVIDPDTGRLSGVIDAASTFTVVVPGTTTTVNGVTTTTPSQSYSVQANGNLDAEVAIFGVATNVGATSVTPSRLTGTASIDIFFTIRNDGTPNVSKTATFEVEGFKQSDTATTTGAVAPTVGA
jgi:hypothetical protein